MIAEDYFSANESDTPDRATGTGRHNRNLNSIVSTIQDDGPSVVQASWPAVENEDTETIVETPVVADPGTARQGQRIRALPGLAVMLRVSAILLSVALLGGAALFAAGKYPAIDERGLHLAALPAGLVTGIADRRDALVTTLAQWTGQASEWLSGLWSINADRAPIAASDVAAVAARQVQILIRLDALDATVDTLQGRLDSQQTARVTNNDVRHNAQAAQLKDLQAQLAGLRQSMADTPALPAPLAGQSRDTTVKGQATETGDWVLNVASSSREASIKALQQKLEQQDIRTELLRTDVKGAPRYRLRVTGFASSGEAKRYATRLEQRAEIKGAWASRR
jgi:hypothetical protein